MAERHDEHTPPGWSSGKKLPGGTRFFLVPPFFVLIPAVLIGLLITLPPVYLLIRSLGASTYTLEILFSLRTFEILVRTIVLMFTVSVFCCVLGVSLAWLTVKTDMPLRRAIGTLTSLPLVIPSYVFGLLAITVLGPYGSLQKLLEPLGVQKLPSFYGFWGATFVLVFLSFPYVMLPVRAAFKRIDPAMEEAARGLGKSATATFFMITLPMLRPSIIAGVLLVALYTLSDFGAVSLLRYQTFTWAIFIQYETAFDRSIAAALSLVLVGIALILVFVETFSQGNSRYYRISPGNQRTIKLVKLGAWRWAAMLYSSIIIGLSFVMPVSILIYWVIRGISVGERFDLLWEHTFNTVYIAFLAAFFTALAAIPIAVMNVRYKSRVSTILERMTYVGFALPGLAVALAFVFFATAVPNPFYQTTTILVIAYLVLFLSASVGSTQAALLQISPRLEEVSRSLGKSSFDSFRLVSLPLALRGVFAGAGLVFLLTMKELPATLILSPPGFRTLATSIWSAASEAFFARAALPALVLILIAGIPMALLLLKENNKD